MTNDRAKVYNILNNKCWAWSDTTSIRTCAVLRAAMLAGNEKPDRCVVLRATIVGGQRKNQTLKGETDAAAMFLPFKFL